MPTEKKRRGSISTLPYAKNEGKEKGIKEGAANIINRLLAGGIPKIEVAVRLNMTLLALEGIFLETINENFLSLSKA